MEGFTLHPNPVLPAVILAVLVLSAGASASPPQITLSDTGWSVPVGGWDDISRTATLTTGVTESIEITGDNITLDGNGSSVTGSGIINSSGILLNSLTGCTVKNLTISGFSYGIRLINCNGITIERNAISNTADGIYLDTNNTGNTIDENALSNNAIGIAIYDHSSDNTITRNIIENHTNYAFQISTTSNSNVIKYNHLSNNLGGFTMYDSHDNQIYNNNIVDTDFPTSLVISGANTFSLPDPIFGNHWDLWTSPDENPEDGIVDVQYSFTGGPDSYPFVEAFGWNDPPVVEAGNDQVIIEIGTLVQLDGNQTFDPEGDSMTYLWAIVNKPAGSDAALSDPAAIAPTFVADVNGVYEISLTATDFFGKSAADTLTVSFKNVAPVADPGENQSLFAGNLVVLDGSGSSDLNLDPLAYLWSFDSIPEGSAAVLSDPTAVQTTFVPDLPGTYEIRLVVNDGLVDSLPAVVVVEAVSHMPDAAILKLMEAVEAVNQLPFSNFRSRILKGWLTLKINVTIRLIDTGYYQWAYLKLRYDILRKMDGWIERGTIDRNDWIITPEGQYLVHPFVDEAMEILETIL